MALEVLEEDTTVPDCNFNRVVGVRVGQAFLWVSVCGCVPWCRTSCQQLFACLCLFCQVQERQIVSGGCWLVSVADSGGTVEAPLACDP